MLGFIIVLLAMLSQLVLLIQEKIKNNNLEKENKELKERINSLEREATNWSFRSAPKSWIINNIDDIIRDIQYEIDSRPEHPNIGKKSCIKRLINFRDII